MTSATRPPCAPSPPPTLALTLSAGYGSAQDPYEAAAEADLHALADDLRPVERAIEGARDAGDAGDAEGAGDAGDAGASSRIAGQGHASSAD